MNPLERLRRWWIGCTVVSIQVRRLGPDWFALHPPDCHMPPRLWCRHCQRKAYRLVVSEALGVIPRAPR